MFENIKIDDIVKTKAGNYYIIINSVKDLRQKVAYFTGKRIVNINAPKGNIEKIQYLTWNCLGEESGEETYSYTGNDCKEIIKLKHNQELRVYGQDHKYIYLDYGNDFKGLHKIEDHSSDIKSIWLK